ncbi:glycosyltransferase involved in cell wall biosynthesis [Mesonia hippocampi]|uniref:Glycosyltransferase involved in cell wall biosynthesis n=1 Tax=Mesonia hippocampi TaxID=1628250 RepID=A0A840EY01_9FLAO|nr:glycosyltransferase involved in cell wall biosynthesis [Mesonia hippocampi]
MKLTYSFIIPVYNRPDEIDELLASFLNFSSKIPFEIVIVEDGSTQTSDKVIENYKNSLNIMYLTKPNTGPGDSRNYGMKKASGNYFIILDSDVILPKDYLDEVAAFLQQDYIDCFGGPDAADASFSDIQKAINYSMTSFLTTGGIRGKKKAVKKFEPRSFNMGLSKKAFQATSGFGKIHPGEDPDLVIRLEKLGFKTAFIEGAKVYHKRRISWDKFYTQVKKFGMVRPILNSWHPHTKSIAFWFPTMFSLGLLSAVILLLIGFPYLMYFYALYFLLLFLDAFLKTKNFKISILVLWAVLIQFFGYGIGFFTTTFYIRVLGKNPRKTFPKLFFDA